jgi:hypothetical protein
MIFALKTALFDVQLMQRFVEVVQLAVRFSEFLGAFDKFSLEVSDSELFLFIL